jgi:hypothetical protein
MRFQVKAAVIRSDFVIPTNAGAEEGFATWMPACAGMTE